MLVFVEEGMVERRVGICKLYPKCKLGQDLV